jgi:hypothetical protein
LQGTFETFVLTGSKGEGSASDRGAEEAEESVPPGLDHERVERAVVEGLWRELSRAGQPVRGDGAKRQV